MKDFRSEQRKSRMYLLICLAAAAGVFGKALFYNFSLEDSVFLNWGFIQDIRNFIRFWIGIVGPSVKTFSYTPLKTASLSLLRLGFGSHGFLYHGFGLAVHALGVVAVYKITRFFVQDVRMVLCATLLFAVHPLHIGGVASIAGSVDMLGSVLMMWALYGYLIQREKQEGKSFVSVYILGGLAIFMTEAALALPLILITYELLQRRDDRQLKASLLIGVLAFVYLTGRYFFVLSDDPTGVSMGSLAVFFKGIIFAIGIGYPQELSGYFLYSAIGCLAFLLCGLVILSKGQEDAESFLKVAGLWLVIAALPLLMIGNFPAYIAGRYLYFAVFAWCLLFSALILMIMNRLVGNYLGERIGFCVIGVFFVFYSILTVYNLGFFRSPVVFYERLVEIYPDQEQMRMDLAASYLADGETARSLAQYNQLLERDPQNAEIYFMMEKALSAAGRYEEAVKVLKQAVSLKADFAEAYYNLAGLTAFLGRYDEAEQYMVIAVRLWQGQGKILEAGQALDAFEGFVLSKTKPNTKSTADLTSPDSSAP